ncbi:MAG TPA: hypothetical protein VH306_10285 [Gaiellaceae bacterium]|jgi:hypothetical protein
MSRIGPTARGFLILVVVAAAITALQLQIALNLVLLLLNILFLVAIAMVLYTLWRNNRHEIATWSLRARFVFYGAAALAIFNIAVSIATSWPDTGLQALVFFLVLAACVYAMFRVWRDQHTYGY